MQSAADARRRAVSSPNKEATPFANPSASWIDDAFSFQLPAMIGWRAWSCVVVGRGRRGERRGRREREREHELGHGLMHLRRDDGVMMAGVQCARVSLLRVYLC